jgi:hypothetical protein
LPRFPVIEFNAYSQVGLRRVRYGAQRHQAPPAWGLDGASTSPPPANWQGLRGRRDTMRRLMIAAVVLIGVPLVGWGVITSAGDLATAQVPNESSSLGSGAMVEIGSATLVGKAVDVEYIVTCEGDWDLDVFVSQQVGSNTASAHGFTVITCTGAAQPVTVPATTESGHRLKKGDATSSRCCIRRVVPNRTART